MHTLQELGRTDGPGDGIADGFLSGGPVTPFAADAVGDQPSFRCDGMMLALLGTADPATLREWFRRLSRGGEVVDDLQRRPWGATDGQVIDPYGLPWLVGYEEDDTP